MRKVLFISLAGVAIVLASCLTPRRSNPVVFTAMGCGPYTPAAEVALERFMRLDNELGTSRFMIHCGDIVTGRNKEWPESQYARVAEILSGGNRIPTFIVPGDNEWNDQADPDRGWRLWSKHFLRFDRQWKSPAPVTRQSGRPENFAFVLDRVLFIGINKVGGRVHDPAEWRTRLADDGRWVAENLKRHQDLVHSAAIFAQAKAGKGDAKGDMDDFVEALKSAAEAFGKPLLYLHADGHKWYVIERDWATNITHVQLDLISSNFPPVQVTVTGDSEQPFLFDRRQDSGLWGTAQSDVESR